MGLETSSSRLKKVKVESRKRGSDLHGHEDAAK